IVSASQVQAYVGPTGRCVRQVVAITYAARAPTRIQGFTIAMASNARDTGIARARWAVLPQVRFIPGARVDRLSRGTHPPSRLLLERKQESPSPPVAQLRDHDPHDARLWDGAD